MVTTNYIWDGESYLAETDENDAVTAVYTNVPDRYTNLVSQRRGATTSYAHFDALGSTKQLTDQAGAVTDEFEYDAWGNEIAHTGTTEMPFRFVGRHGYYRDEEINAIYILARTYQPAIARWWSADPLGFIAGMNLYLYVSSLPTTMIDPSGLADFSVDVVAKSFIVGAKASQGTPMAIGAFPFNLPSGPLAPPWIGVLPLPFFTTVNWRLNFLGALVSPLEPFNQNPQSSVKDGKYRLYSRNKFVWSCCGPKLTLKYISPDKDGGIENFKPYLPYFALKGSMDVADSGPVKSGDCMIYSWMGYGKPHPLAEPSFQWVTARWSKNIWHLPTIAICCDKNGNGYHQVLGFIGSKFPTHRLWIDGISTKTITQGAFSDLWFGATFSPFFVTE